MIKIIQSDDRVGIESVRRFLKMNFNLGFDENTEHTLAAEKHGKIVGTVSSSGNVIKQLAVCTEVQGSGLAAELIGQMIQLMIEEGRMHLFLYTKPSNRPLFSGMGFREVITVHPHVSLFEWGNVSIKERMIELKANRRFNHGIIGGVVINGNPFTSGHRYLVETASKKCDGIYLFVVQEDRSLFPYAVRKDLIEKGTADLENVVVLGGGEYIISQGTFPSYFTQDKELARIQTALDAEIFGTYLAPALGIIRRFVGNEPYCDVTNQYNAAMKEILPKHGITLEIVDRRCIGEQVISAKTVRQAIREGRWDRVAEMVPAPTLRFLESENAKSIIQEIVRTDSRH